MYQLRAGFGDKPACLDTIDLQVTDNLVVAVEEIFLHTSMGAIRSRWHPAVRKLYI